METRSKVSDGSESLKKAIGAAIWQSGHKKLSNFSRDARHRLTITKLGLRSSNAIRAEVNIQRQGEGYIGFTKLLDPVLPTVNKNWGQRRKARFRV